MNLFDRSRDRLIKKSKSLQRSYKRNKPCPHLVIDDLFDPKILNRLLNEFLFKCDREDLNWQITADLKLESLAVERLSDFTRTFYFWLNSQDFVSALNLALDRQGRLVGDPSLYGSGLCGILPGGKLESCSDIIVHPHLPLICQYNLIICLNPYWNWDWGGAIELYSSDDENSKKSYTPWFNRTVILPITDTTKYKICTSEYSHQSSKFLSIYYWSLIKK